MLHSKALLSNASVDTHSLFKPMLLKLKVLLIFVLSIEYLINIPSEYGINIIEYFNQCAKRKMKEYNSLV